jgi:hypothetical protein
MNEREPEVKLCEDCNCPLTQYKNSGYEISRWRCNNDECDTGWIVEYSANHIV